MENYLDILEESLRKKLQVLEQIKDYNERQRDSFQSGQPDMEQFDAAIEEKGRLIEQVNQLDEGFETLYAHVAQQLEENRARYTKQIRTLQALVKQVTDESMAVQAQEARNKALIEEYFSGQRKELHQSRKSSKAAFDYYKSMNGNGSVPPQFYDNKK